MSRIVSIETAAGAKIASSVMVARSFLSRFLGLLSRRTLHPDEGLLLLPGGSIHTIGMRFAVDAIFLDREFTILKIAGSLQPQRLVFAPRGTRSVLEMNAGAAQVNALRPGMRLTLNPGA